MMAIHVVLLGRVITLSSLWEISSKPGSLFPSTNLVSLLSRGTDTGSE